MNSAHVHNLRPQELYARAGSQSYCHLTLVTLCLWSSNTFETFKDCFKLTRIPWAGCSCYLRVLHVVLDSCTPNSLVHPCPYPGSPHIPTQNANMHNESLCAVPCFQDFPKPLWSFPSLPLLWLFKEEDVITVTLCWAKRTSNHHFDTTTASVKGTK